MSDSDILSVLLGAGTFRPHDLGDSVEVAEVFDAASELPAAWIEMLGDVDEATCMTWGRFEEIMATPSPLGDHRRSLGAWGWTCVTPILEDADHRVLDRIRKFDHLSNRQHGHVS